MTRRLLSFWLALALLACGTPKASADQSDERLDVLFEALRLSQDRQSAQIIEQQIWEIWGQTSEGPASLLYEDGVVAMANGNLDRAVQAFSALVEIAPDFAEAWNKRATAYYLQGRFDESVQDIQKTLVLEPRHFGALSGFGLILMRLDQLDLALETFKSAVAIHPHMPAANAHIELLEQKQAGEQL